MTTLHRRDHLEFADTDGGCISGPAFYSIHVERDYSSDIGGVDGLVCNYATLYGMPMGSGMLDRDTLAAMFGEDEIRANEVHTCTLINEELERGEQPETFNYAAPHAMAAE